MNWSFFHKLGSPKWFYDISGRWLPWFAVATVVLLGVGVVWGLVFAPQDYQQGNSFRIIYIHVPAAFVAQSCYVMLAVAHETGQRGFAMRCTYRRLDDLSGTGYRCHLG